MLEKSLGKSLRVLRSSFGNSLETSLGKSLRTLEISLSNSLRVLRSSLGKTLERSLRRGKASAFGETNFGSTGNGKVSQWLRRKPRSDLAACRWQLALTAPSAPPTPYRFFCDLREKPGGGAGTLAF